VQEVIPAFQVLHKVADAPLICHAIGKVLEGGWAPIVVVINPQNGQAIKEVCKFDFPHINPPYVL